MGLTIEPAIEDYWKDLNTHDIEHIVKQYIGIVWFQQLDRHFWASPSWPNSNKTPKTTFNQINELTEHIRLACKKLYTPKTHLTINETIQDFTGYTPEIINIPFKPTPKGFKIWVFVHQSYVLNWL